MLPRPGQSHYTWLVGVGTRVMRRRHERLQEFKGREADQCSIAHKIACIGATMPATLPWTQLTSLTWIAWRSQNDPNLPWHSLAGPYLFWDPYHGVHYVGEGGGGGTPIFGNAESRIWGWRRFRRCFEWNVGSSPWAPTQAAAVKPSGSCPPLQVKAFMNGLRGPKP